MMIHINKGRKIIGFRSKDLDLLMCYKGKWQRNHGLSRSKDLDFNRYIKKISKKIMGVSRSKDLKSYDIMYEERKKNHGVLTK